MILDSCINKPEIMTTWKQPEYERVMEELRRAEDKEKRSTGRRRETMVTKTMTSDPDFLTEKEMNAVASVYRSHGTSQEEGTILPRDLPQESVLTISATFSKKKLGLKRVYIFFSRSEFLNLLFIAFSKNR